MRRVVEARVKVEKEKEQEKKKKIEEKMAQIEKKNDMVGCRICQFVLIKPCSLKPDGTGLCESGL